MIYFMSNANIFTFALLTVFVSVMKSVYHFYEMNRKI